jgi:hypothetical protein
MALTATYASLLQCATSGSETGEWRVPGPGWFADREGVSRYPSNQRSGVAIARQTTSGGRWISVQPLNRGLALLRFRGDTAPRAGPVKRTDGPRASSRYSTRRGPTVGATVETRGRADLAQSGLRALAAEHGARAQAGPRAASTASRTRSGPKRITSSATTPQACSVAAISARAVRSSSAAVLSATAATRAGRTGRQTAS